MSAIGYIFRALGDWYDLVTRPPHPRTEWYCEECDDNIRPGEIHYSNCSRAERDDSENGQR